MSYFWSGLLTLCTCKVHFFYVIEQKRFPRYKIYNHLMRQFESVIQNTLRVSYCVYGRSATHASKEMLLISSKRVPKIPEILDTQEIKRLGAKKNQTEGWKYLLVIICVNGIPNNDDVICYFYQLMFPGGDLGEVAGCAPPRPPFPKWRLLRICF